MIRLLLAAALLATPLAAASDGIELYPPATSGCTFEDDSGSSWQYHEGNGSRWWWDEQWSESSYSCASREDDVDGGVYAHGNRVVDVNAGSGGAHEDASSSAYSYGGSEWWWNGSYGYSSSGSSAHDGSHSSSSSRDATVSTILADAEYDEGCWSADGYSHQGQGSYSTETSSWGTYESWGEQGQSSIHRADGCAQTVALTSNVTDVRGGQESACQEEGSSTWWTRSWSGPYGGGSESQSGSSNASSCESGVFASLGSERIDVGSSETCEDWSYEETSTGWNETYSSTGSSCEERFGAFGPTGLGVYLQDRDWSWEDCDPQQCFGDAGTERALVVEHAYTGRNAVVVPN